MKNRRVGILNGRQLASALWLLRSTGEKSTYLGVLDGAAVPDRAHDPLAAADVRSWAAEHGLDWPADFMTIEPLTPGVPTRPAMQELVARMGPQLEDWLNTVWPNGATTDPFVHDRLHWIIKHGKVRHAEETILLLPCRDHVATRVTDTTYVISNSLLREESAFQAWARRRHRSTVQPLRRALSSAT